MTQTVAASVAANVRAEMARAKTSSRTLAAALPSMTATTLSRRLRNDEPFRVDEIAEIATALGVPISDLMPSVAA